MQVRTLPANSQSTEISSVSWKGWATQKKHTSQLHLPPPHLERAEGNAELRTAQGQSLLCTSICGNSETPIVQNWKVTSKHESSHTNHSIWRYLHQNQMPVCTTSNFSSVPNSHLAHQMFYWWWKQTSLFSELSTTITWKNICFFFFFKAHLQIVQFSFPGTT